MGSAEALQAALAQAAATLAVGEAASAERQAKAISALARADRDVAELLAAERAKQPEQDEESVRAELRRRLALFAQADLADAPAEVLERIAMGELSP